MQESEWLEATEEIRRVFGQRMKSSDTFELVDVLLPVGRTGVEVLLGVDESHGPYAIPFILTNILPPGSMPGI